ncbi:FitA-like ribbon-helix-helix domain-containing protein [Pantoea ananatis]|uniref:FitA-like ribbon-helix-helix domain-containing protein n=1 Tax=Pantoea ananas TaxID=553 RepID=UPI00092EDA28|nr:hypothetical protein [Pantoea ananatis]
MAKIQARNVDDALYECIEQSAMKNERSLEGEIRTALREYYQPVVSEEPVMSERERWQCETGMRLKWLFDRLMADNYLREYAGGRPLDTFDLVRFGRQLNTSPGFLMDIMEGWQELTFELADVIAQKFDASADWLLGESGQPFPVKHIGGSYEGFFFPSDGSRALSFELYRISKGQHEGKLFCLRRNMERDSDDLGVLETFSLKKGPGSSTHSSLKEFLVFLKTRGADLAMNTYDFDPPEPDFDFWKVIGQHHPAWFQDTSMRSTARWLQQIFIGDDPADWFTGRSASLEEIGNTPFGKREQTKTDMTPVVSDEGADTE